MDFSKTLKGLLASSLSKFLFLLNFFTRNGEAPADYIVITAGGSDYDRAAYDTWVSKIQCQGDILTWNLTSIPSTSQQIVPKESQSQTPQQSQGIILPNNQNSAATIWSYLFFIMFLILI